MLAGHLDKEAGQCATASLVARNIICFVSAQLKWKMRYADTSAAFLQGEMLGENRMVYIRVPMAAPTVPKGDIRIEFMMKGAFGLAAPPRLWCLQVRIGLESIGLN